MKLSKLAIVLLIASSAVVASAADPQLLRLVMPEAKVVSGIDADRVRTSPFGKFLLTQIIPSDKGFEEAVTLTGFDPRRDIREILVASPADPKKKTGLLLVRGAFDAARVVALLRANGKTPVNYHGVDILNPGGGPVFAFLDAATAVAGDEDSVKAAIDRRTSPVSLNPAVITKINLLSASQDAWAVSLVPVSAFAAAAPDPRISGVLKGDLFNAIEQISGGIRFGSTIEINGEATARTEKDAGSLVDVLKFFTNLAQLNAPKGQAFDFAALIQNLNVRAEANTVKLSVAIPEADVETLIKLSEKHTTAAIQHR